VRNAVVTVAAVIIRVRRESAGERIHPCARADLVLVTVKT
jgi:hypothetical protein